MPDILSFGDELSPQNVQVRWREPAKTAQQSNIPVTVERQLYRLIPGEEEMSFTLQPVTSNEIDSDALYLDEITLTSEQDAVLRYGQVEVPPRREPTLSAQHGAFRSINLTLENSRGNCWKKRVMKWANWPIWCR